MKGYEKIARRVLSVMVVTVVATGLLGTFVLPGRAEAFDQAVTLAPTDCMATGGAPIDQNSGVRPFLPFYQPAVGQDSIDQVVQGLPNYPGYNRFTIWDAWDSGNPPTVPITSWSLGTYTGLTSAAPLSSFQRGHTDSYGYSGVQAISKSVGLWLNSMDPTANLYNGSNSLNVGCWYNSPPYAKLFPSVAHQLDVSFTSGVAFDSSVYDGSDTGVSILAYFEFIAFDESDQCKATGGQCRFTFQVVYYSRKAGDATIQSVHGDDTNTTSFPIAQTTVNSSTWLHRVTGDGAFDFQQETFQPKYFHFRISPAEFMSVVGEVSKLSGYSSLSSNPLDYAITLIGVNGEVHVPSGKHGQLGLSVSNVRVTSTISHHALSTPAAFNGPEAMIVYRDGADVGSFTSVVGSRPNSWSRLATATATGEPSGYFANGAARVVYLDPTRHIREIFRQGGVWSEWDMSAELRLGSAYSDPKPFADGAGNAQVVYRDDTGNVHLLSLDQSGWHHANISTSSVPSTIAAAAGAPMGYQASGAPRIVYRDNGNQVVELFLFNGVWNQWQMTSGDSSGTAYSDPQGYVDVDGFPRVVYRDSAGDIHELRMDSSGWHHSDITSLAGAPPAVGNPRGLVAGSASRVIYRGVDQHVHELVWWNGAWQHNDLSGGRGAVLAQGDPVGLVGNDGITRIEYVGGDAQLHEFYYSSGWLHRDM
ncbi:hypothetical protein [Dyella koreensis]|uniref:Uncharacterized protein n=1 Tax=Dyella koreensis TaxID=311235 RepID=A0ABW8KA61_9GAMM